MTDSGMRLSVVTQREAKRMMRRQMTKVIELLSDEQIEKESRSVTNQVVITVALHWLQSLTSLNSPIQVLASDWFKDAKRMSIFASTKGEIITDQLIAHCLTHTNKKVFIPRFQRGSKEMEMLQLRSMKEFMGLDTTLWDIRQHPAATVEDALNRPLSYDSLDEDGNSGIDLVLIPGMAFTTRGDRLGHGMGYYDKWLHAHKEKFGQYPMMVALSLQCQLIDQVPTQSHDVNIDLVVTSEP